MVNSGKMAETLAELGALIEALKSARANADEFHLRARKVEDCLKKLMQAEALSGEDFFNQPEYSVMSEKLMKELWFAKKSSELRLAGNLHAYL